MFEDFSAVFGVEVAAYVAGLALAFAVLPAPSIGPYGWEAGLKEA
jgi:hypothetical protein